MCKVCLFQKGQTFLFLFINIKFAGILTGFYFLFAVYFVEQLSIKIKHTGVKLLLHSCL